MGFLDKFRDNGYAGIWLYLVAINVVVFLFEAILGDNFVLSFALTPATALAHPWTFVTAAFLHNGFTHLFFNMFALFMFGPILEQKIGSLRFVALYFAAAIAGNIGMFAFLYGSMIPGLGASGAIFGVMGALAVLEPNMVVFVSMLVPLPMWMAAIAWTALEFVGAFDPSSTVGHWAHLGGLFLGIAYAFYLKKKIVRYEKEVFLDEY
jgi:uncharacterized protein